jgi:hypothetical protein
MPAPTAMSDAVAAPVPNRRNPLRKPTSAETMNQLPLGLGGIVVGGALGAVFYYLGLRFFGYRGLGHCNRRQSGDYFGQQGRSLCLPVLRCNAGQLAEARCQRQAAACSMQKVLGVQSPIEQAVLWPRGCRHRRREQRSSGCWRGSGQFVQIEGCPLLRRAQKSRRDDHRNRQPGLSEMALAPHDAQLHGRQPRSFLGRKSRAKEMTIATSPAFAMQGCSTAVPHVQSETTSHDSAGILAGLDF